MRLKSCNYLIGLLIIFFCSHLVGEDKIDIWDNKKEINKESTNNQNLSIQKNQNINSSLSILVGEWELVMIIVKKN